MTITSPSRRERLRTATATEIKQLARQLLTSGGAPAISLRSIARDMGMTAPAIYRYFPSLNALVRELTEDLFDELRHEVERARDSQPGDPLTQLLTMARAFRRWSLAHPAEFELVFGRPEPGVISFEEACDQPDHAAARFGEPFLTALHEVWLIRPFATPPAAVIAEQLGPHLSAPIRSFKSDIPVEVIYTYISAWIRLYGLVAMEVFGHLRWAVTTVEPLFEMELASFASVLSAEPA